MERPNFFSDPSELRAAYHRKKMGRKHLKFVYLEKFLKVCLLVPGDISPLAKISELHSLVGHDIQSTESSILSRNLHPEDASFNTSIYSKGILFLGVKNFLSAAVKFIAEEARRGTLDIVSVGSGDGSIEKEVDKAYRELYGNSSRLNFVLIDSDLKYEGKVDFKYVDDLIEKRPQIVENCVLFIIWPPPAASEHAGYDIYSIRMLQPRAVLSVYGTTSYSGSEEFLKSLQHDDNFDIPISKTGVTNWMNFIFEALEECQKFGLDNYLIDEVIRQEVLSGQIAGTTIVRLTILRRTKDYFFNTCPVINVTCERSLMSSAKRMVDLLKECPSDVCPSKKLLFRS